MQKINSLIPIEKKYLQWEKDYIHDLRSRDELASMVADEWFETNWDDFVEARNKFKEEIPLRPFLAYAQSMGIGISPSDNYVREFSRQKQDTFKPSPKKPVKLFLLMRLFMLTYQEILNNKLEFIKAYDVN